MSLVEFAAHIGVKMLDDDTGFRCVATELLN